MEQDELIQNIEEQPVQESTPVQENTPKQPIQTTPSEVVQELPPESQMVQPKKKRSLWDIMTMISYIILIIMMIIIAFGLYVGNFL